jgi:hypothetical protein
MDKAKVYEITLLIPSCHSHESGNPVLLTIWIPASAGMTKERTLT